MRRKNIFVKSKNYIAVTDSLAKNKSQSRKELAEAIGLSLSTVSKVIGALLDIGIVKENTSYPAARFSFFDDSKICIVDLTGNDYNMYICTLDGGTSFTVCMKRDDRFFAEERLSLFLRECASHLKKHQIDCVAIRIVVQASTDIGVLKNFSLSRLKELCVTLFKGYSVSLVTDESCISVAVRAMVVQRPLIVISESNSNVTASVVSTERTSFFSYVRDAFSGEILRNTSDPKIAARTAIALGNTVKLLNVSNVVFDLCFCSCGSVFCDSFRRALDTYVGSNETESICLITVSEPLTVSGAKITARRKYIESKLYQAERDGII